MIVLFLFFASTPAEGTIRRITSSKPPSWMLTYELVSSASRRGLFLVLHPNIALSPECGFGAQLCQRPFFGSLRTHKYAPLRKKGAFAFCIQMTPSASYRLCERPRTRRFSFEDGLTRRSAKLAQRAFAPALASRGAQSECRATPQTQIGTGFKLRAPNSSARAGFSVSMFAARLC